MGTNCLVFSGTGLLKVLSCKGEWCKQDCENAYSTHDMILLVRLKHLGPAKSAARVSQLHCGC